MLLNVGKCRRQHEQADVGLGMFRSWLKAYVGMSILMGIVLLPRIEMYWSKEWDLLVQLLAKVISNTRFEQILYPPIGGY